MTHEHHHTQTRPRMAVITQSTLEGMGLAALLQKIMPMGQVDTFCSLEELRKKTDVHEFVHYFISSRTLMEDAAFFLSVRRVIILTHGNEKLPINDLPTLNVEQSEMKLLQDLAALAQHGHTAQAKARDEKSPLTRRETEVLRLVVQGCLNKEIAQKMGIEMTTVISHRKNLTRKLGMRSVSALTVYAVTHGLIRVEEISGAS